jgi:hypothetical protein
MSMVRRKEEFSMLQKFAALVMVALFLVLTLHSAFVDTFVVTLAFGTEFAILLYVFADSFNHEFNYVSEKQSNVRKV